MTRSTQATDLLNDLIRADAGGNGSPLSPDARSALEAVLTRILVDPDRLRDHIRFLQKQLADRFRHRELLDEATTEAVMHRRLTVLDDVALARLALNPIALVALAEEIEERQPTGWAEALREDGLELLHAHGRTVPRLDDPLGGTKSDLVRAFNAAGESNPSLVSCATPEASAKRSRKMAKRSFYFCGSGVKKRTNDDALGESHALALLENCPEKAAVICQTIAACRPDSGYAIWAWHLGYGHYTGEARNVARQWKAARAPREPYKRDLAKLAIAHSEEIKKINERCFPHPEEMTADQREEGARQFRDEVDRFIRSKVIST
jgi:hypothetical protein